LKGGDPYLTGRENRFSGSLGLAITSRKFGFLAGQFAEANPLGVFSLKSNRKTGSQNSLPVFDYKIVFDCKINLERLFFYLPSAKAKGV